MHPAILTGMHRSGTSAIARLVQALGISIGSDLLPAAGGNLFGHFEEVSFIHFHDKLIDRLFPQRAPFCEWLPLADTEVAYTDAERDEARSIWKKHHATGGNAWKDPRTSLFLDLWTKILPEAKTIICLRHPYQAHCSLLRRGEPFLHVDYSASIVGWTIYNQRILRVISSMPKGSFLVVDVEQAFQETRHMAEALARFLELPFTEETLDTFAPEAFHFENELHEALEHFEAYFPDAMEVYRQLKQFDFLHPAPCAPATMNTAQPLRSAEVRLLEFEESQGLRPAMKKMLVRSIAFDRKRMLDLYKHATRVDEEKDRLIRDQSQLTELLKQRVAQLEGKTAQAARRTYGDD
jgi:hypothetical protein